MDRLERFLPPRLAMPLLAVVLAGLPWLILRPWGVRSIEDATSGRPPAERFVPRVATDAEREPAATREETRELPPAEGPLLPLLPVAQHGNRALDDPDGVRRLPPVQSPGELGLEYELMEPATLDQLKAAAPNSPTTSQSIVQETTSGLGAAPPSVNVAGTGHPLAAPSIGMPAPQARPSGAIHGADWQSAPRHWQDASGTRSEQLEKMARQADRQIRHGFDLANRGAYYAARAEFTAALRLIAQGLDAEEQATVHSRALGAAWTAMREAQDFIPAGARLESELDMPAIVGSHRTELLKRASTEELRPLAALQRYLTFTQEQLSVAAGHEVAGSIALCALGKLHAAMAAQRSLDVVAAEPKAVAFFQASLLVEPQNYMAANELGVFRARCGDYAEARRMLEYSTAVHRTALGLNNLAAVYEQMGDRTLAESARQQAEAAARSEAGVPGNVPRPANSLVQWVAPAVMAQASGQAALR
jgi:tetratricopeptide (TPR) repeat protein